MPTIDINLVLGLTFLAWHYALFCGYISDDHAAVAQRQDIIPDSEKVDRGESFWVKRFNDGIVMFYHTRIMWALGFKNMPFFWHAFSLIVHLLNVYLLQMFLEPIIGHQASLYASAFWGVNPMLNQNVVWISGRPYAFGLFFALIALNCWFNPLVFIPFYMLAVITNISIFFVPIIIFLIHQEWQTKLYLLIMLLGAFPFLIWKFNKRFTKGLVIDRENFKFRPRKINVFAKMILYYTWTLFVPVRMGWYHQAGFRYNEKWEKFNYLTLVGYIMLIALVFYFKLPGWIFLFGLIPVSNIFATNSFLQDRYLYFASIGIAMIVSSFMNEWIFIALMTFYITRTYMYSRHLKDDEKLYRENWRNHPKSDYAINNLSYFLIQQKRYEEARVVIERGLNIDQGNKMLWYNLGITHAAQGHFNNDEGKFKFIKALDCWKTCLRIEPRWTKPANDLKSLIKLLIEKKVLTLNQGESNGASIDLPNLVGVKEMLNGTETTKTISQEITPTA